MRAAEAGEGLAVCLSLHVFVSLISLGIHSCLSAKSFCALSVSYFLCLSLLFTCGFLFGLTNMGVGAE